MNALNRLIIATLAILSAVYLPGCVALIVFGAGASDVVYENATGKTDKTIRPYLALHHNDCAAAHAGFTNAIAHDAKDPRAYAGRGDARLCLEQYDDAIADYTLAIKLDPKWFDYFGRGLAYKAKGQANEALANFDSAIALNAHEVAPYLYRGVVLNSQGKTVAAQTDFTKVVTANPRNLNDWAWFLATASTPAYRDGAAAVQFATRACDGTSWKDPLLLDTLAAAHAQDGQFEKAIKWQTAAIDAMPIKFKGRDDFQKRLAMYQQNRPFHDDQYVWLEIPIR